MKTPSFLLSTLILPACLAALHAEETPTPPSNQAVGSVYGKTVTAANIGMTGPIDPTVKFDSRDTERWKLMGRILTAFGKPVSDRFIKQHKIEATAKEIESYKKKWVERFQQHVLEEENQLNELKAELAVPDLPDDKRKELEERQAMFERSLPRLREVAKDGVPEAMARQIIVARKIERELHQTYGGRVIFQQAGPEALDARRLLYEEAEKKGELKFDAGVRHLFYYYYSKMNHTVIDEDILEKMWASEVGE